MKRLAGAAAALALGFMIVTPALAGHHGYSRGHGVVVRDRGVYGGRFGVYASRPHAVFFAPRPRVAVSFAFGLPGFYAGYYAPAPAYYAYPPAPVVVAPAYCEPAWVPGHYVWDGGARFWIEGHWSR
jgi:hypothetical protein